MKKIYTLLLVLTCLLMTSNTNAQTTVNVMVPSAANGTSGNGRGPVTQFLFHRSCAIYSAAEFTGLVANGDSIQRIGWSILTAGSSVSGTMKIYLVNTTDATFTRSSTWATLLTTPTALTLVYNGPMTIPAAATTYSVVLPTPFKYTGSGLYLAYEWTPTIAGTGAVYNCNTGITNGQWNANNSTSLPTTLAASNFRAQILVGVKPAKLDAKINEIYTLGKMPIPYTAPHAVSANLSNIGIDTLINYPVILKITGANAFVDTFWMDTLKPGVTRQVSFAGFNPTVLGNNLVTVSVPADSNNGNNSKTFNQVVTATTYTYAEPTLPAIGGVGFTGGTGDFVAKFAYSGVANAINQVGVNFFGGGISLAVGIWSRNAITGQPGTLLWQSSTFTSVTGLNTIPVSPAVTITDTFFVGVIQSSTVNANFAFQNENPIRSQTFYYRSPTASGIWTDFAPANSFRFMIEPRLQAADDIGFTAVNFPCKILPQGQTAFNPIGTVINYGTNPQSSFQVKCRITNASNAQVYYDSTIVSFLNINESLPVTFTTLFNPTVAGTYTIKTWSDLTGDASSSNDTASATFVINNIPVLTQENRLQFNGSNSYVEIANKSSVKPTTSFTLETWVLGNNALLNPGCIFSADSSNSDTSITIETVGRKVFVTLKTTSGVFFLTSNDTIPTNNWAHVAATYDGATLALYINGDTAGSMGATGLINYKTNPIYLGKRAGPKSTNGVSALNGGLDEFRMWNIARTQHDIIQNMHNKIANFSDPNLVIYYRMNEGLGNASISDASGNCNSGDLINMDANITGLGQVWFGGSVMLDTIPASIFNIFNNSIQSSTSNKIAVKVENPIGNGSFAVTGSTQALIGTTPTGFANNSTTSWVVYKYGDMTFDSARFEFTVPNGSILSSSTNADLTLNGRLMGFGAWNTVRSTANTFERVTNNFKANYLLLNTDTFNRQFVVSSNTNSLPVSFISFNGSKMDSRVMLNWITGFETNNKGFEVERSIDGKEFSNIGFVKGQGNSNKVNTYSFLDEKTGNENTIFYRLKQVDFDGKYTYSSVIRIANQINNAFDVVEVLPNPFDNDLTIKLNNASDKDIQISIYNSNGILVNNKTINIPFGLNSINMDEVQYLSKGFYVLKVNQGGNIKTFKLIK
ncbi:MAG: LamG-like jellyroll fold domain-containing protein [Bacteroidota bacterium]